MARCRSCDAEVVWVQTTGGKLMPLDADTDDGFDRPQLDEDGNVVATGRYVTTRHGSRVMEVEVLDQQELFSGDRPRRYRSHFQTCPDADAHRKPVRS